MASAGSLWSAPDNRRARAAGPGAGDNPGPDPRSPPFEARLFHRRLGPFQAPFGDSRDQKVLPDGEADIAIAVIARDFRERAYLRAAHLADREHDAEIEKTRLLLRMRANMRLPVLRRARPDVFWVNARKWASKLLLHLDEKTVKTARLGRIVVEHIFQPRLGTVGAVSLGNVDAHDRVGDLGGFAWLDDGAGLARQIPVPGDAADNELEPDARRDARAVFDLHRLKADVVGVLERRDRAAAVEGDVELAGQTVERALI